MKEGTSEKQHSASGTVVALEQQNVIDLTLSSVSVDVFFEIIKKFSFTEIARLHLVARSALKNESKPAKVILERLLCNRAVNSIWLPYLKILKQMDSGIPLEPPANFKNKDAWYYSTVMRAAGDIYQRQNDEIDYLRGFHPNHNLWPALDAYDNQIQNLNMEALIARDKLLNAMNSDLIMTLIDEESTTLDLSHCHISRIPEDLLNDENLAEYWYKLHSLDCFNNLLQEFPNSIDKLVSLQQLRCTFNQLQTLPASIGNLSALKRMECGFNQIQILPDSIGDLVLLEYLNFSSNRIYSLPVTIGNLAALQIFNCGSNQLKSLPETILNLQVLRELDCSCNQLKSLPETILNLQVLRQLDCSCNQLLELPIGLQARFGKVWVNETLNSQEHPVAPAILPQFEASNAERPQAERREERLLATVEPDEEARDNAVHKQRKKPKGN